VPISRRLLDTDESVVVSSRTHGKALIGPLLLLAGIAAVAGTLGTFTGAAGGAQPLLVAIIWAGAAVLAARWVLRPGLQWLTTTYTVTDRRLITRSGVLTRRSHDIPLDRVSDVAHERGLVDRLLGCGTLMVAVGGEYRVEWRDIPHVEHVHLQIQDLLDDGARTRRFGWDGEEAHERR
jgi:uncharacterized membrane protein YdbT with pleckstrin-like domain